MAGPDRVLFIRHAEHHSQSGITEDGMVDQQSLNARGWQRAGALVARFSRPDVDVARPNTLYASAITENSESRRPQQTISPLLACLRATSGVAYCDAFAKHAVDKLVEDVMTRSGVVLIAWEHSVIPDIAAGLGCADAPKDWPSDRYDLIWSLTRHSNGWSFAEHGQLLLLGDQ